MYIMIENIYINKYIPLCAKINICRFYNMLVLSSLNKDFLFVSLPCQPASHFFLHFKTLLASVS